MNDKIYYYKKAANIFNNIKKEILNNLIKNKNISIKDIISFIQSQILIQTKHNNENPLKGGIPFPPCIGINNIIAHYTPPIKFNDYIIKNNDLVKIDFGVHINGYIIDSAFTFSKSNKFNEFINIAEKTNKYAFKLCRPDKNIYELGEDILEYIESKEIYINNKIYNLSTIKNLSGHNITRFNIHGKKTIPSYPNPKYLNSKIFENDVISIEPFITTNQQYAKKGSNSNMYNVNYNNKNYNSINKNEKKLLFDIKNYYKNFFFTYKYAKNNFNLKNNYEFNNLIKNNFINKESFFYVEDSFVTHFESNMIITNYKNIKLT